MGSVNKVILVGNVCADPDLRYIPNGTAALELRVATNEEWTDAAGQKHEKAEFHRVQVWAKKAEVCAKYLKKGSKVYVDGSIQTRTYDDKDGKKTFVTEIRAHEVVFL